MSDHRNVNRKFIRYIIFYIRVLSYDISCRTTDIGAETCNICNKMNGCGMIYDSDEKTHSNDVHPAINFLPGFDGTAQLKKPVDKNLSPLMSCNSNVIQYKNGSIASVCTDSPLWSPGECLFLSNYEGQFRRKQSNLHSPVICLEF